MGLIDVASSLGDSSESGPESKNQGTVWAASIGRRDQIAGEASSLTELKLILTKKAG
jgi:hypothetical protein